MSKTLMFELTDARDGRTVYVNMYAIAAIQEGNLDGERCTELYFMEGGYKWLCVKEYATDIISELCFLEKVGSRSPVRFGNKT